MPIGGFVITVDPEKLKESLDELSIFKGVEIHGSDKNGNVIAVLESTTSREMEEMVKRIMKIESVYNVGLTYFHGEDELERQDNGPKEQSK